MILALLLALALALPAAAATKVNTRIVAGTNVTISPTSGVGDVTINASGGAGASWTQVELDFGVGAQKSTFSYVTDATVTAASKIMVLQSGIAATGRQADENEMDAIVCRAIPATGTLRIICSVLEGVTHGLFKVNYTVN